MTEAYEVFDYDPQAEYVNEEVAGLKAEWVDELPIVSTPEVLQSAVTVVACLFLAVAVVLVAVVLGN